MSRLATQGAAISSAGSLQP